MNLNWPPNNPDLVCECSHQLRGHSVSFYQDMQVIWRNVQADDIRMIPSSEPYEKWSCTYCDCKEMKISNLRYLEQKYDESKSTI